MNETTIVRLQYTYPYLLDAIKGCVEKIEVLNLVPVGIKSWHDEANHYDFVEFLCEMGENNAIQK